MAACVAHLAMLVLNNLPWSPLVEPFYGAYYPYLAATGNLQQGWSMYDEVHRTDNAYHVVGWKDGRTVRLPFPGQAEAGYIADRLQDFAEERDMNFLESLAYDAPQDMRTAFGKYLCKTYPGLQSVSLLFLSAEIIPLEDWQGTTPPDAYASRTVFTTPCSPRRA